MDRLILKTLVGSHAHGLNTKDSDLDYRGVYITSTSDILKVNATFHPTSWVEGKEDNTSYELVHFLHLALKSSPTILETLVSPIVETTDDGNELRRLLPKLWSSDYVVNSVRGYAHNQRKKFLEDKDERPWKYAVANIRTLLLGIELLKHGTMTVDVADQQKILGTTFYMEHASVKETLLSMKEGYFRSKGFVIDWANMLEKELVKAYEANPDHKADMDEVNKFLLRMRRENW